MSKCIVIQSKLRREDTLGQLPLFSLQRLASSRRLSNIVALYTPITILISSNYCMSTVCAWIKVKFVVMLTTIITVARMNNTVYLPMWVDTWCNAVPSKAESLAVIEGWPWLRGRISYTYLSSNCIQAENSGVLTTILAEIVFFMALRLSQTLVSPVYAQHLTRIGTRVNLTRIRVNALTHIANRIT